MVNIMAAPGMLDARRDSTVTFLPHRLNRQPIIVLGLTADELWITVGLSGAIGLAVGIVLACMIHSFAMAPTVMIFGIAAGVFFGGAALRRHKRGRPDTWAYRQLQWWVRQRFPLVSPYLGGNDLITRSGYWTTRRTSWAMPVTQVTRR